MSPVPKEVSTSTQVRLLPKELWGLVCLIISCTSAICFVILRAEARFDRFEQLTTMKIDQLVKFQAEIIVDRGGTGGQWGKWRVAKDEKDIQQDSRIDRVEYRAGVK